MICPLSPWGFQWPGLETVNLANSSACLEGTQMPFIFHFQMFLTVQISSPRHRQQFLYAFSFLVDRNHHRSDMVVTTLLDQWFPTGGTRTPRGTQAHCRGYVETFNNHLCYVILFENHQHGGTHGMINRLRGYTRQKRLGNTGLEEPMVVNIRQNSHCIWIL